MKKISPLIGLIAMLIPCAAYAQPDPQSYVQSMKANPNFQTTTGEQFAWHANVSAGTFVDAYLAYNDPAWLEAAVDFFDHVIDLGVSEDPDGFPGIIGALIGETLDDPNVEHLYDAIVGDALIGAHITRFAEVVMNRPELHAQFLDKAQEYIDLATEMVWEKWNARDTYYQDTRGYGSYHTHPYAIDRANPDQWVPRPNRKRSENLNKHYKAGTVFLRLYRMTGNTEYRDRVLQIFGRAKAMFRLFPEEDRVVWMFWMPHGPHDMTGSTPSSWVGVHPNRAGYQSGEASEFLEVYNSGFVFDETDMQRIVNTNLWMMDNDFVSADGTSTAGTLWSGLAQLEPRIRDAYEASLQAGSGSATTIRLAYLQNVIDEQLGYDRVYVDDPADIIVDDVEVQPGVHLGMAHVIPDRLETINDDRVQIIARTMSAGEITIDLLTPDGEFIGNLDSGTTGGNFYAYVWDGTNPETGSRDWEDYLVRWTLNDESRTWPVSVVEGEERPPDLTRRTIRPGQTLHYDFDQPLDERWELFGAEVTDEQSQTGANSLRVRRGERADLVFGDLRDLPVRVEFWVHDGGAMLGKEVRNGPTWGVQTDLGDFFVLGLRWRAFLDGDNNLIWVNTADNQFFNAWSTGLTRILGWSHWVFDFSDHPDEPVIIQNGTVFDNGRVTGQSEAFLPTGAIGLTFRGSNVSGDQEENAWLYVDNVTVTHTGEPISVFQDSPFSENLGDGWKWSQLGLMYDALFPWVYSPALESWIYVVGFTEIEGYHFWVSSGGFWAYARAEFYPYYADLTGENVGTWVLVTP